MSMLKKIKLKKTAGSNAIHPWIYKNHISEIDPDIGAGDIVEVIDHDKRYFGTGYYNPNSVIAITEFNNQVRQIRIAS
jgi:23S rRNA G2069 N7-methylase RlmK/C1962 C5-methylase RlmI